MSESAIKSCSFTSRYINISVSISLVVGGRSIACDKNFSELIITTWEIWRENGEKFANC